MGTDYKRMPAREKEKHLFNGKADYIHALIENAEAQGAEPLSPYERDVLLKAAEVFALKDEYLISVILNMSIPAMSVSSERSKHIVKCRVEALRDKRDVASFLKELIRIFVAVQSMSKWEKAFSSENFYRGAFPSRDMYYERQIAKEAKAKKLEKPESYAKHVVKIINNSLSGMLHGIKIANNFLHKKASPFYPRNNTGLSEAEFLAKMAQEIMSMDEPRGARAKREAASASENDMSATDEPFDDYERYAAEIRVMSKKMKEEDA